ncbi:Phosphoglucosamine mutase [bioreactor metagenome]|uniref:Phosphoglucosamine mutase n=1 Tax=bioreactor metagenome TaxID=1076179 RepID=A0A645AHF7_9ZZZZ
MLEDGYVLGGEQSGHIIFLEHATTGDGQLAALQFLSIVHESGKKVSALAAVCKQYPQVLINVPVADPRAKASIMALPELHKAVGEVEKELAGEGRILVRPSGTESLIRVMVEAKTSSSAKEIGENLANMIKNLQ